MLDKILICLILVVTNAHSEIVLHENKNTNKILPINEELQMNQIHFECLIGKLYS